MPAHHGKKVKEQSVKVKREPTEVKPLSEYVDDRLELIKQAFACLKPKTIKGITPKCLQKESLESIQEQCLDEMLGISKKRLLSIINDTKCPTDTESSDDDDEVIEHISLDEISSDEESKPKSKQKKKPEPKAKAKKIKEEKKENPAPGEKKEYSVLELLELQARARAIRSQLALEPVTKIELDGDDSDIDNSKEEAAPSKPNPKKKDKKASEKRAKSSSSSVNSTNTANGNSSKPPLAGKLNRKTPPREPPTENSSSTASRPIKIKRNFRKQVSEPEKPNSVEVKQEAIQNDRESSPEVETIQAIPETLCISSSDDEEPAKQPEAVAKSPEIAEKTNESSPVEEIAPVVVEKEDPEEGEIGEESQDNPTVDEADSVAEPMAVESASAQEEVLPEPPQDEPNSPENDSKEVDSDVLCVQLDDDCIDLECDDGIEDDLERSKDGPSKEIAEETVEIVDSSADEEVGDKDSASNDSKSWGERWLGSSKVSKILAASKLGNTMRRKIKLSKQKEKMDSIEITLEREMTVERARPPEVDDQTELGSVDHYKKIVEKSNAKRE